MVLYQKVFIKNEQDDILSISIRKIEDVKQENNTFVSVMSFIPLSNINIDYSEFLKWENDGNIVEEIVICESD